MDPDETLRALLEALKQHRWDDADDRARDLWWWLLEGGFPPRTLGPKALGIDWHRTIAASVIKAARDTIRDAREPKTEEVHDDA